MTKRCSHKPPVARRTRTTKRRTLNTKAMGRRPRFECLERRNLLTAGMDWGDTELLMATMLFEESVDVVETTGIFVEDKVQDREFDLLDEPMFMAYLTADADMETDVTWYGDSEMPMFAMFSWDDFESDETFVKWDATDVEFADEAFDLDDQPMLMRFSLANVDDDWSEEGFKTQFLDDWDSEVVDGEWDLVGEPMLTAFFATDAGMEVDDLPQRMRFTADESDVESDEVELVDGDPDAEIMMFTAMGPSPWHNAGHPEDVNVDGWATPIDALLIINGIGQDALSSTSLRLPVSLFLDVNGDRRLDTSDAIQVINLLNGGGQLESDAHTGADSRMAPLWYGEDWAQPDLREDTEDSDQLDSEIGDTVDETDAPPRVAARRMDRSDESDDQDDDQSDEDGGIFSDDADWLLPELL
jgi:hypothetical protein